MDEGKLTELMRRECAALRRRFGAQGWWPRLIRREGRWSVAHRIGRWARLSPPSSFEVALGAILTQNASWTNVERALVCLAKRNLLTPGRISSARLSALQACVRSSGYYRQKARKLKIVARFFLDHRGSVQRDDLIGLWGIGPETADTMLLYGFHQPVFVVDAYTRRWMAEWSGDRAWLKRPYDDVRRLCESALPKSVNGWQDTHALIVRWGKETRLPRTNPRPKMR